MLIGVPKEIKSNEFRVAISPAGVVEFVKHGHKVFVETNAGSGIGYSDADYAAAGANIAPNMEALYSSAELIVKVKEPQPKEIALLKPHHVLFSYLHLAPDPELTKGLIASKCVGIAFETVTDSKGSLPLLAPMSEIAGKMAIQQGAYFLENPQGGSGVLLGSVPGVPRGVVSVLGGGVVGTQAARVAIGFGAKVIILDNSINRLRQLEDIFGNSAEYIYSSESSVREAISKSDLVVGAVLIAGAAAPRLVTKEMLKIMKKGSVIVDVAIDQGGCFETSKATTHQDPVYTVEGVIHYCVANIPGSVAKSSSRALENAILPYAINLANNGYRKLLYEDIHFRNGLNVMDGHVTHKKVADSLGYQFIRPEQLL